MHMQRVSHFLRNDQIKFMKDRKKIDRSEHIRRALDDYMAKIRKEEQKDNLSPIISPSKGVANA